MNGIEYYNQKYREEMKARNERDREILEWARKQESKTAPKRPFWLASSVSALCLRGIEEGGNE